jgi:hypothetical protein
MNIILKNSLNLAKILSRSKCTMVLFVDSSTNMNGARVTYPEENIERLK